MRCDYDVKFGAALGRTAKNVKIGKYLTSCHTKLRITSAPQPSNERSPLHEAADYNNQLYVIQLKVVEKYYPDPLVPAAQVMLSHNELRPRLNYTWVRMTDG